MTQTRHKFPEFQSEKSARTGICTIVRVKKPNLHIALINCVFLTLISIGPQMLAVWLCNNTLKLHFYYIFTNKLDGKRGVAVGGA